MHININPLDLPGSKVEKWIKQRELIYLRHVNTTLKSHQGLENMSQIIITLGHSQPTLSGGSPRQKQRSGKLK